MHTMIDLSGLMNLGQSSFSNEPFGMVIVDHFTMNDIGISQVNIKRLVRNPLYQAIVRVIWIVFWIDITKTNIEEFFPNGHFRANQFNNPGLSLTRLYIGQLARNPFWENLGFRILIRIGIWLVPFPLACTMAISSWNTVVWLFGEIEIKSILGYQIFFIGILNSVALKSDLDQL